jgi:two-component system cell cycle response regulator DivK
MLLQDKRIYTVEDNVGNLAISSFYLEAHGAKMLVDRRGVYTVQMIRTYLPIDLIMLDLMLPNGVSGFDLINQIRQQSDLAKIPVVAVSAMDPDQAVPKARKMGFDAFICKPMTPRFAFHIADVLSGKKIWITDSLNGF